MKNLISALIVAIAFIFVLGSVGAFDNGSIGFGQFFLQASIGLLVTWLTLHITTKKER